MPYQPGARRAPTYDCLGEERIEVVDRVDLRRRGCGPVRAEQREATFHFPQYKMRFFTHGLGTRLAMAHGSLGVACAALARLAAAGDDEARHRLRRFYGEAERVKRRLGGRTDFRAHIAARNGVAVIFHAAPVNKGNDVTLVELAKAIVAEWPGRAQLARANSRKR